MTNEQTQIILDTWAAVSKIDDETVGNLFYNRLFEIAPGVRPMFRSPMPEQSKKLMAMLHYLIRNLDKPEEISNGLTNLAKRHANYHVQEEHYNIVGAALLWTLEQGLGAMWNDAAKEAWVCLYTQVAGIMIAAGKQNKEAA